MDKRRILVVDDDRLFRDCIVEILNRKGYDCDIAGNGPTALEMYRPGAYDMIVSDMKMPMMTGIELCEQIRTQDTETPFLMITAHGDVDTAVDAMKKGASDYIQKSDSFMTELEFNVERLMEYRTLYKENKRLRSELTEQYSYVGATPAIQDIRKLVDKVASSRATVLITGESGTGKELVARSIHYLSPRSQGPFVKINCAALPEGLIESELFGHEKGAFTGAIKRKLGKFELASKGTLLLDEIGELPMSMQAKLLRVLQEREIQKVGGDDPVEVDVRIVATTNRDLEREVQDGRFRQDLYFRLNVFRFELPSLRNRVEDIPNLAEHFIKKFNNENGFSVDGLTDEALKKLTQYDWPGNIRELENAIERAVVLTCSGTIDGTAVLCKSAARTNGGADGLRAGVSISAMEKELILKTLEFSGNNRTKAAQMLDISIRTLRNKLHEYALDDGTIDDDTE